MKRAILIVDDEAIIVMALAREFRNILGPAYRYETALSGAAAFEIMDELDAEDCEVAALVSDWLMPGMKGDEFLVQVRRRYPDMALVLVTGQGDDEAIERAIKDAGAVACVKKPWRGARLAEIVRQAIEGHD